MNGKDNFTSLGKLFSPNVIREMAIRGRSRQFVHCFKHAFPSMPYKGQATVADAFDAAFESLNVPGHRDAYVFLSALIRQILPQSAPASLLPEFRVGSVRADLVVVGDVATVYEIKSDRDNLTRLPKQIAQYRKVFARVYVISSDKHVPHLIKMFPEEVGILCLRPGGCITQIRVATDDLTRIDPVMVFESLRLREATDVLARMGIVPPAVPNTQRHTVMRDVFSSLKGEEVYQVMTEILRHRRDIAQLEPLQRILPPTLHAAILSISLRPGSTERLERALSTPIDEALRWT